LAMLGDGERATHLLGLLNPIHHPVERYEVEPYVVAADVYDAKDHVGRGGWTWYTGSAAWMYRVVVEHILGVRSSPGKVTINPCVAKSWPRFEVTIRDGEGEVHVVVENPKGVERGVVEGGEIALTGAKGRREARVVLG